MNKFIKGCLIAALFCTIFGISGCSAGVAMGAGKEAMNALEKSDALAKVDQLVRHAIELADIVENKADYGEKDFTYMDTRFSEKEITTHTFPAKDVQNIEGKVIVGDVKIVESKKADTVTVTLKNRNRKLSAQVKDGTLCIEDKGKENHLKKSAANIIIELPKQNYQTCDFDLLAGDFEINSDLTAKNIKIAAKAGDIKIKPENKIEGTIKLEASAGDVNLSGIYNGDLSGKLSAGDFKMKGQLEGNLELDCSAGDTKLDLAGDLKDYNYQIRSSCGDVKINEKEYEKGMGGKYEKENGAKYLIKLKNSAGDIEMDVK